MKAIAPYLKNKTHVIWDWNGTLLDDVDLVVEVISSVLAEQSLPGIHRRDYVELFCFPVVDYYRRLGFDFEKTPFETLSEKFTQNYKASLPNSKLHAQVPEFLAEIKAANISQSVLSAAHQVYLEEQLVTYGVRHYFDHVYGLDDYHAHGKIQRGKVLMAEAGIPSETAILVGDTDHDLEVAKALGVDVLLLGDGHQSFERLNPLHHKVLRCRNRGNVI